MRQPAQVSLHRQRGAIMAFAAIALSVIVITLSLADIGFLYYYKREYQKAADLAAMAGAKRLISLEDGSRDCAAANDSAQANATQNLGGKGALDDVQCGLWAPAGKAAPACAEGNPDSRIDDTDPGKANVVRVVVTGTPPNIFMPQVTLSACATAVSNQAVAALHIRSTLAQINGPGDEGNLINSLCTFLAPGNDGCISVGAGGWTGLVDASIELSTLATKLGAGTFDELLDTEVSLGTLLGAAATALPSGPGRTFLLDLNSAVANVSTGAALAPVRVGDLLGVSPGTPASALDVGLNVVELAMASVQAATKQCAVCATAPIIIPGLAGVNVYATAIEPAQMSAIGDPELAIAQGSPPGSEGPNRLYVNTAQVRVLATVDVSSTTSLVTNLLNAVADNLGDVVAVVGPLAGGDLFGTVSALVAAVQNLLVICNGNCPSKKLLDAQAAGKVDVSVRAAHASAYITDYDCNSGDGIRSLDTHNEKVLARVSIGEMGSLENMLSSQSDPVPQSSAILDIGYVLSRPQSCAVINIPLVGSIGNCSGVQYCTSVSAGGGSCAGSWVSDKSQAGRVTTLALRLRADTRVGGTSEPEALNYEASPPEIEPWPVDWLPRINEAPQYQDTSPVSLPGNLLNQLNIEVITEPPLVGGLLSGVLDTVEATLGSTLALLNPTINNLLATLGVNPNDVDVGAHMSCGTAGAALID